VSGRTSTAARQRRAAAVPPPGGDFVMPAWVVPVTYALVCVVLFRETVLTGVSLLGVDSFALSYFARNFYTEFVQSVHRMPYWNPLLFGGMPFVDGMHGDIFYPPSLALFWMDARAMWGWKMVLHYFLAGIFTYLWLRRGLGLGRPAAFLGGLIYMTGPQIVSLVYPGGDGKLFVSALAPLVFWTAERAASRRGVADFSFFALAISAIVLTSHMQLAYFCVWGVSLYFIFRVARIWRVERAPGAAAKLLGMYALAGVLGVGAAAAQFAPPLGYLREWSHRVDRTVAADHAEAYAYSTSFSLHFEEIAALVVPEFVGDNVATMTRRGDTYWGRNPFKLNHEYAGFIPILLGLLLFVFRPDARAWFFLALATLSLLYALGANTPFFRIFYLIPGVSLFRAPSLIIFLYALSIATLGALGAQRLLDTAVLAPAEQSRLRRALWGAVAVLGLGALLASTGALASIWISVFRPDLTADRLMALQANEPNLIRGFWITTGLALLVTLLYEAVARGLAGRRELVIALAVLATLDTYRVGRPFVEGTAVMNRTADPALFRADDAIGYLLGARARGEVFRVFDLGAFVGGRGTYGPNVLAVHGLEQLAGHHGNEIGRYRRLIGGEHAENVIHSELRLLNLLNVAYLISPARIEAPGLQEVHASPLGVVIYRNAAVRPRAFVTGQVEIVPDSEVVDRLLSATHDPGTALVAEPLPAGVRLDEGAAGSVRWQQRGMDELRMSVFASGPALLVVMDNHYPAWRAWVNGEAAPIVRANYTFRAIPVPPGDSEIVMRYEPEALQTAVVVSGGLLLLLFAVAMVGTWRRREAPVVE
jgi:hypothetical protein